MCPLVDTINHSFQPNAHVEGTFSILDNDSFLVLKAETNIEIDEEITLNYGNYGNHDLLMKYGFVETDNKFNEMPFVLDLDN